MTEEIQIPEKLLALSQKIQAIDSELIVQAADAKTEYYFAIGDVYVGVGADGAITELKRVSTDVCTEEAQAQESNQ